MNANLSNTVQITNLSIVERALRLSLGLALLGSVMIPDSGVLGWTSVLALVAIYPILTGLTGADPLRSVMEGPANAYRISRAAISVVLLGVVFLAPSGALGLIALLPLLSIYSAFGTVVGRSPVAMLIEANQSLSYVVTPDAAESDTDPDTGSLVRMAA